MNNRIALIGIMSENGESSARINDLLHENAKYIVGRMGIPRVSQRLCVISVVLDAPMDIISALTGKLGMLDGVNCKAIYAKENSN